MPKEVKIKPSKKKQSAHYVNNREFSLAVIEYVKQANEADKAGLEPPQISNYIGECFMKICEGLSHKDSYITYSYRDEMVMDAIENCVKAITNFDRAAFEARKLKATSKFKDGMNDDDLLALGKSQGSPVKSVKRWYQDWLTGAVKEAKPIGIPNAFAYFTQIAYFAFLRRIAKEKKQWEIKMKYIETASIEAFADFGNDDHHDGDSLIARIRGRTTSISHRDDSFVEDDSDKPFTKKVQRGWGKKKVKSIKPSTTATLFNEVD